jgi:ankyrin repeat protein
VVQLLLETGQHCGLDEEALGAAAEDGHLSVMQLLIQQGADPCWDTTEFQHGRALANAIKHMQPGATLLLLQAGAVPGESALVQATTKTNPRVVQALLDHGATDAEANALTAAARSSRQCWPVVELLLHMSHKEPDTADPNSLCSRLGLALVAAAGNGQYQMVEHLLSYHPQGTSDSSAPASVSQEDLDKALCAAACMGHDAPCVQPNGSWYAPIDSSRFESRDYCTIVMLLVENGADVDAQEDAPMRGALRFGDAEMRDLLMEFGANPNVQPMKTVDDEIMEGMQRFHEELMAGKYPELHVHGSALECASL